MILSQMLAARLFSGQDPVGRHIQFGTFQPYLSLDKQVFTVVGIAANTKNRGLAGEDDPEYYQLLNDRRDNWGTHAVVLLQTALPVATVAPWVRARIAQIDPNVPVEITPLSQTVSRLADRPRFETALLSFFAATGLMMAIIGLYGVVTFMAQQRTQEIGIRMALGATRGGRPATDSERRLSPDRNRRGRLGLERHWRCRAFSRACCSGLARTILSVSPPSHCCLQWSRWWPS